MWARIEDGHVAELTGLDPEGRFHESLVWVECPAGTGIGSAYDGGAFSPPAPVLPGAGELPRLVSAECRRRIYDRLSSAAQMNIVAYAADLALSGTLAAEQQADMATARAIRLWVNGPDGMQAKCRALIAAADPTYADDGHWPAWDPAWDAFVARF